MTKYEPTKAQAKKIAQARGLLRDLKFDTGRTNERSALVLLTLAQLLPGQPWSSASNDALLGIRPVMDWMRDQYGKVYAENSRETIRRFTMHQFVAAGLVVLNPDDPARPTNSPDNVYQLSYSVGELLRSYETDDYATNLRMYLEIQPGLQAQYASERDLHRIPVTLPGTKDAITLSPGGQNVLLREMIEDFCPRFTPGGSVLYVGDAASKSAGVYDRDALVDLGVTLSDHGKMPDLIVHMPDRDWLVLLEAASSHGPVDAKRHRELKELFSSSTAGLVFVSCFPSRATMRKYLAAIAWETEVWCSDNPDHLIHFNGERFLGPYT